jgi:urease accessory protein
MEARGLAPSWLPRTEGSVRLAFAQGEGGRTALARLHQSGAARVRFPKPAAGDTPEAVLLNTAGGLTGGDHIEVEVALGTGCNATVTSAAAEKIYRSLAGDTEIRVRLNVGEDAGLAWLPQPSILFDCARFDRRTEVALAGSATLLATELLIFGRAAMGEDVRHGAVRDVWRVRRDGRLVFADSFKADGPVGDVLDRRATFDGARAAAILLYAAPDAPAYLEEARALLEGAQCVAGASCWNGLLAVRALAREGRTLQSDLEPLITRLSGRPLPRVWQC